MGLHALKKLGFSSIEGVDLSLRLLNLYQGTAQLYVGDWSGGFNRPW